MATLTSLPEVSLADWDDPATDRRAFAGRVADICHEVGFFTLVDHGIGQSTIDGYMSMVRRFFALPDDVKATIEKVHSPHCRGWERLGSELTDNKVDHREQVDLWTERVALEPSVLPAYRRLVGPNPWLSDDALPGFRSVVSSWFATMESLAGRLMEVLAVGLGLPGHAFHDIFGPETHSLLKLIHYPPTPAGAAGVNGHHDSGFLTILLQHEVGGLQVRTQQGEWIDVAPQRGAFNVNLGEMLQAMTGNYYVATMHKVVSDAERYSSAFFHGPSLDTPLAPVDLEPRYAARVAASEYHRSTGFMARREQLLAGEAGTSATAVDTYGDQLWNYFLRSYPDIIAARFVS
ncbi:MAG: isopenicillin N synthase family dioxygenase [Ilumatobacteraceae bacterium]